MNVENGTKEWRFLLKTYRIYWLYILERVRNSFDDSFTIWYVFISTFSGAFYGGDIIEYKGHLVALVCGPNGVDIYFDFSGEWKSISNENIWVADFTKSGKAWLAGTNGKILKLELL